MTSHEPEICGALREMMAQFNPARVRGERTIKLADRSWLERVTLTLFPRARTDDRRKASR